MSVSASELFRQGALPADDQDVENNIAVEVIGWWHAQAPCRVATSVRLKQAPPVSAGLRKGRGRGEVLKITPTLYYNTTSHVVTFVSESVESCVTTFTVGWTSVRRLIVIARESKLFMVVKRGRTDFGFSRENAQNNALEGCQTTVV